ncbi:hypothetical protein ACFIJ5_04190 [Haloimpatiens sp. FM7330]|uniref:hypothetical protein n=1 Tax=Haloimpatiens sp. FM7330 TaxID=3298610 RepID=UPI00362AE5B9
MKSFKKIICFAVAAMMILPMAGCGSSNKLLDAIQKTSKVNSYAFNAKVKLSQKGGNQKELANLLSNMNFTLDGKVQQNKDKYVKTDMNIKLNMMGIAVDYGVLSEVNLDKNNEDYKVFMKLPEFLKSQMPAGSKDFDYLYLGKDSMDKIQKELKIKEEQIPEMQTKDMVQKSTKFQQGFYEFVKTYTDENGKKIVVDNGNKDMKVNGKEEKLHMYQIKIDNEGLKKFLKAYLKDEKRQKELTSFLETVDQKTSSKKFDVKKALSDIDKMPKIIGDKGIVLEFGIKNGYVAKEILDINLVSEKSESFSCNVDIDIFDINKDMKIQLPSKKDSKVVDYYDFMKQQMNAQEKLQKQLKAAQ